MCHDILLALTYDAESVIPVVYMTVCLIIYLYFVGIMCIRHLLLELFFWQLRVNNWCEKVKVCAKR